MKPTLQFGKAGLSGETPKWIKTIYRCIMAMSAVWAMVSISGNMGLSDHAAMLINGWLAIGNAAIYQFCQAFGYIEPETTNTTAPTEQVNTFSQN